MTLSQPDSEKSSIFSPQAAPALLIRKSNLSSLAFISSVNLTIPSIDPTSAGIEIHSDPYNSDNSIAF